MSCQQCFDEAYYYNRRYNSCPHQTVIAGNFVNVGEQRWTHDRIQYLEAELQKALDIIECAAVFTAENFGTAPLSTMVVWRQMAENAKDLAKVRDVMSVLRGELPQEDRSTLPMIAAAPSYDDDNCPY